MASFDAQLADVRSYLADLRAAGRPVRDFASASSVIGAAGELPVRVGPGASAGVILRSDTHVELGNPQMGSCGIVLWTADAATIADGRVTLVGPDIPESSGGSLPFAQILFVGGRELGAGDYPAISQAQYVGDRIEGYMVRSSARSVWARVSKEAVEKGFDFACLGRALIGLYKSSLPKVEVIEVAFVTSASADVKGLESIATAAHQVGLEMVNAHWKARGYELDCSLDCKACHDKDVCDDVREVIAATMRKERAEHV
jgi:CO dehydrogenase/acetyl-CoA synthase beta subunit